MKNLLLGALIALCFAATTQNTTVFKRQQPKYVATGVFDDYTDLQKYIALKHRQGYSVKDIVTNGSRFSDNYRVFIIMERY